MAERIPDVSDRRLARAVGVTATAEPNGRVTVARRRFGPVRSAMLRAFRIPPTFTVHLDPLGTEVWNLVDGSRTVGDVLRQLEAAYPGEQGLNARLGTFVGAMVSRGFLVLK